MNTNISPNLGSELHCAYCIICDGICESPKISYYNFLDNEVMKVCSDKCHELFMRTVLKILFEEKKKS